ncbi:LysR family transcriptional regulator [Kitasatospora aureofaciens]|uniref:LysR family transcriptional regulator n=1 Tax=Kitasatospora aureofaciens TaxID=1894 RepID=UPI001C453B42|nr:LysR family transcriptional regulator [Kitasatospora aureofaciens]MBV6696897.1 LysR family transcriptional regulator [Kitasatospora aureofaciens]
MELRDIEIFLALAEELHFGRTAARLHVSPARVSQAIKQQERRIGGALFDRTSRSVRLTPLGQLLCDDMRPVYTGLLASLERARLAARGVSAVLRIGMINTNGYDLRPFWEAFRSRHPQCELRIRHHASQEPFGPLRRDEIDVLVAWLPIEEADLTTGPVLFTEPKVLGVGVHHPLAERGSASLEHLADFGVQAPVAPVPEYWEDAFQPFFTPAGRAVPRREMAANWEENIAIVADGGMVTLTGAHATRYNSRPDIAYLPIDQDPCLRWGLVWRTETENDLIRGLAQTVRSLGAARL